MYKRMGGFGFTIILDQDDTRMRLPRDRYKVHSSSNDRERIPSVLVSQPFGCQSTAKLDQPLLPQFLVEVSTPPLAFHLPS